MEDSCKNLVFKTSLKTTYATRKITAIQSLFHVEPLFEKICKQESKYKNQAISWDPKSKSMSILQGSSYNWCYLANYLQIAIMLSILAQIFFGNLTSSTKNNGKEDVFDQLLIAYVIPEFSIICVSTYINFKHASELVLFVNSLFQQNSVKWNQTTYPWQLLNMVYAWLVYFFLWTAPTMFVFGFHWNNPCKNILFGWWMIPECSSKSNEWEQIPVWQYVFKKLAKFGVLFFNHIILSKAYSSLTFGVAAQHVLFMLKLNEHLKT